MDMRAVFVIGHAIDCGQKRQSVRQAFFFGDKIDLTNPKSPKIYGSPLEIIDNFEKIFDLIS